MAEVWKFKTISELGGNSLWFNGGNFTVNFTSNHQQFVAIKDEGNGDIFEYIKADNSYVTVISNISGIKPKYEDWDTSPYRTLIFDKAPGGELLTWLQGVAVKQKTISDTLTSIQTHISEAYTALANKSATIPADKNIENLKPTIESISTGIAISDGTATAATILKGKIAYAKGVKVIGTIETYGGTVEDVVYTDCLTFTGETGEFTLKATNKEWDGTLYYSTDHNTWNVWDGTAISSANKKLYLKGKDNTKFWTSKGARLSLSAKAGCSGNIQTLLDWESPPTSISTDSCYNSMFYGCTNLTTAPALPATTLTNNCYDSMFYECTSLTQAPELPATTLAEYCYYFMFYGCTSLTQAPALPATTLAKSCYNAMFLVCTGLTAAPELPATTLAPYCYAAMFRGCTGLTAAPELPATTLAENCYNAMFLVCRSLTTAPALPATTLANYCYRSMFNGCTNLTTAPALPATTLTNYCYSGMFAGCTNLTTAPALPATTLADYCYDSMFSGCTNLITAPELPATTLTSWCYSDMFTRCTNLTTAPNLPATTLAENCYRDMFNGCSKLKLSTTQTTEYKTPWRIPSSGTISSEPSYWNTKTLTGTGGTFTGNPSINTTYYGAW